MTGGGWYRAEVGAEAAFERLGRELSGYYRVGDRGDPSDAGAKDRHMKVQVARTGLTVHAREIFDVQPTRIAIGPRALDRRSRDRSSPPRFRSA